MEQLLRIFDYLAFESDAEMPAVRLVADLIWENLPTRPLKPEDFVSPIFEHPGVELMDRLRRGLNEPWFDLDDSIPITPVDRAQGYTQFNDLKDTDI